MVGADGALPLPWLLEPLQRALSTQRAHALLVQGPQGVGQYEFGTTLAQAWLCESPGARAQAGQPCGLCASCRLMQAHVHPDLLVLLPEAMRESLGWKTTDSEGDQAAAEKGSKAKPSKEIKVDAVRAAVAFAQSTSARGRGKVLLVHPAERMNAIAANALLKTLEEPPGDSRFVLCCAAPDALPPTIRSRCQAVVLALPPADQASQWLSEQGVLQPEIMLAAAGGQPQQALEWAREGLRAAHWAEVPKLLARGDISGLEAWPLARLVEAMQKLCHDSLCVAVGAAPRYFPESAIAPGASVEALCRWAVELNRSARHADHPWSAGLMSDALVQLARRALAGTGIKNPA